MNESEKPFRKSASKNQKKTVKIKVEFPHVNKKTTSDKANLCSNTVFSLYFNIRAKKFQAAKPLTFSLHFLFRRDQNHKSQKRQRPNTIQILWIVKILLIVKNQEKANNSPSYRCAAIKNILAVWDHFRLQGSNQYSPKFGSC